MVKKEEEFKHLVRIAGTDVEGTKQIPYGLSKIVGIGLRTGEAMCEIAGIDPRKKFGYLTEKEEERLKELAEHFKEQKIPHWMFNRRRDYDTGSDVHVLVSDLAMSLREDLNRLKKIKSYRGIRHSLGLPVRGQRTRTGFRGGVTVGVSRKKAMAAAKKAKEKK